MQLNCLLEAIPGSGCSFGDTACQCSSSVLQDKINACLAVNCTMQGRLGMYTLSTSNSVPSLWKCSGAYESAADMARSAAAVCGLSNESQSTNVIVAVSCFFVGTAVFVMLRTFSKIMTRTLYAEDHIITLAVTLAMAPFVCVLYSK